MNYTYVVLLVLVLPILSYGQEIEVIQGHAHNDYEHPNPLKDALENGFISVEVDVHLIEDELYVSHDYPQELNTTLTLEKLYLDPLRDHIRKNNGTVYPNYTGPFYLMIDSKTSAKPTYEKLKVVLLNYLSIISIINNGEAQKRVVQVLISGNRPIDEILQDGLQLVAIDGRPDDLKRDIPSTAMPVISDNYKNCLSWNGYGAIREEEVEALQVLVRNTHAQNKMLRLWASPENTNVWRFLLDNGLDLINTDRIEDFRTFAMKRK